MRPCRSLLSLGHWKGAIPSVSAVRAHRERPGRRPAGIQADLCLLPRGRTRNTRCPSRSVAARTGLREPPRGTPEPPGGRHGEWLLFVDGQNKVFWGHPSPGRATRFTILAETAGAPQPRRRQQIPRSVWGMPLRCSKIKSKTKPTTHTPPSQQRRWIRAKGKEGPRPERQLSFLLLRLLHFPNSIQVYCWQRW